VAAGRERPHRGRDLAIWRRTPAFERMKSPRSAAAEMTGTKTVILHGRPR